MKLRPMLFSRNSSKRGSILEIFLIIVVVFTLALCIPITKKVYDNINESVSPELNARGQAVLNGVDNLFPIINGMFIFIVICLGLGAVMLVSQSQFSPMFYPFAIMVAAIAVVVAGIFVTAWGDYSSSPDISATVDEFSAMDWAMNHLILIVVGIVFLIIIVMFSISKLSSGGGGPAGP